MRFFGRCATYKSACFPRTPLVVDSSKGGLARARKRSKYEPSSDRQDMVLTGQLMPRLYMLSLRELCSRQLLASLIINWFGETAGLHQFTGQKMMFWWSLLRPRWKPTNRSIYNHFFKLEVCDWKMPRISPTPSSKFLSITNVMH